MYIDDVLFINNPEFENYLGQMYPAELEIKDATESTTAPSYLDLSRSLFLHFNYVVSVTAGGPVSPRGHM